MRTTSGSWRIARDFPNLPAWIVKAVGGSTVHWAGASLRFQEHEFKAQTDYGDVQGAKMLDWPITLAELEPWYAQGRGPHGRDPDQGIPGLPGNNNFKVFEAGADKLGYKEVPYRPDGDQHPAARRPRRLPADRLLLPGLQSGAKWSTLYTEIPKGEATGKLEVRPNSQVLRIEHDASGKVTGVVYTDKDGTSSARRRASCAWPATPSRARVCC